jgi:hypothetical protein
MTTQEIPAPIGADAERDERIRELCVGPELDDDQNNSTDQEHHRSHWVQGGKIPGWFSCQAAALGIH